MNFCPPKVTVDRKYFGTKTKHTREDAKHPRYRKTAFSVMPDSYEVNVCRLERTTRQPNSHVEEPKIDLADYRFLKDFDAVSAMKPGPDSTPENPTWVYADNTVWWAKA